MRVSILIIFVLQKQLPNVMATPEAKPNEDQNEDQYWIWGIFYYNPKDRQFFHAKRNANMGVTMNMAHPAAKFVVALLLLIIIAPFLLVFLKK